jgi:hypothetical protein
MGLEKKEIETRNSSKAAGQFAAIGGGNAAGAAGRFGHAD